MQETQNVRFLFPVESDSQFRTAARFPELLLLPDESLLLGIEIEVIRKTQQKLLVDGTNFEKLLIYLFKNELLSRFIQTIPSKFPQSCQCLICSLFSFLSFGSDDFSVHTSVDYSLYNFKN